MPKSTQSRLTEYFHTKRKHAESPHRKRLKLDTATTERAEERCQRIRGVLSYSSRSLSLAAEGEGTSRNSKPKNAGHQLQQELHEEKPALDTPAATESAASSSEGVLSVRKRKEAVPTEIHSHCPSDFKLQIPHIPPYSAKRRLKFSSQKTGDLLTPECNDDSDGSIPALVLPPKKDESPGKHLPSPSKLDPSVVRKKVGRVRNLHQLRSSLAAFSGTVAKLNEQKERRESEQIRDTKTQLDASSPTKSSVKSVTPKKQTFAHERFASLVEEKQEPLLTLPVHYRLIFEMFRSTETLVSLMSSRDELITFQKLKSSVQQMMKKNFEKKHLGQIKTVYPEAYELRLVKLPEKFGQRSRPDQVQLVVSPNLETDLVNYGAQTPEKTPRKSPLKPTGVLLEVSPRKVVQEVSPRKTPEKFLREKKRLTISRQLVRREIFRNSLLNIVKQHHREFLESQSPPVYLTKEEEALMQRWNPRFEAQLGKVRDVLVSELPRPPSEQKSWTAKELLHKATGGEALPELAKRDLEKAASETPGQAAPKAELKLKGIPASLLQKIRSKQALNEKIAQLSSPEENLRKLRLSRLPDIVRILRNLFLTERKNSLNVQNVLRKLGDSYGQFSQVELESHIELLIDVLPDWISQAEIPGKGKYLKIRKETKISDLLAVIDQVK